MTFDNPETTAGDYIRSRRIARGLSMSKAAELAEMSWDTWNRIEGGDPKVSVLNWRKAAAVVGLDVFLDLEDL